MFKSGNEVLNDKHNTKILYFLIFLKISHLNSKTPFASAGKKSLSVRLVPSPLLSLVPGKWQSTLSLKHGAHS